PDGRGRAAAACVRLAREEQRRGLAVALDLVAPVRLHRVDDADDSAVLALVRVGPGLAGRRQLGRLFRALVARAEREWIGPAAGTRHVDAEQRQHEHDEDRAGAAADGDPPTAHAAAVLDLAGVESGAGA